MTYSVFDLDETRNFMQKKMFLDDPVTVSRYDKQKYPIFDKLVEQQLGFFWRPQEIDITRDARDFKLLSPHEQHIFTSNIKRQILLDSVQGRAPTLAFLPIVSLPEVENWIQVWAFSETIHSRSYSHLIRNVYNSPDVVFDGITDISEIVDCATDISSSYDKLIDLNNKSFVSCLGDNKEKLYEHKVALWKCLMSVNILEGIRFYASFACSWNFAEQKKMEGNAKIIKKIANDENLHLAATQHILKLLPKDDEDYIKIRNDTKEECVSMFRSAAEQEKKWAEFIFKDGSMIGLNTELLCEYVEWITNRRLQMIGFPNIYKTSNNPLPWTNKWIGGSEVQHAPQQVETGQYIVGGVKNDILKDTFSGFSL